MCQTAQPNYLDVCPVEAMDNHLRINHLVSDDAPLFAFQSDDDSGWAMILKHRFMSTCSKIWAAANMEVVFGHSFRIGSSLELLVSGVAPEIVAVLGGWTSLAFLLYWRRIEDIIPMHITKAYQKKRLIELAADFESFHIRSNIPNKALIPED